MEADMLLDRLRQAYRELVNGQSNLDFEHLRITMKELRAYLDLHQVDDPDTCRSLESMLLALQVIMKEYTALDDMIVDLLDQTTVKVRATVEECLRGSRRPQSLQRGATRETNLSVTEPRSDAEARATPLLPSPPLSMTSYSSVPARLTLNRNSTPRPRPALVTSYSTPDTTSDHSRVRGLPGCIDRNDDRRLDTLFPTWTRDYTNINQLGLSPTSPLDALAYAASIASQDPDHGDLSSLSTPSRSPSEVSATSAGSPVENSPNIALRTWFLANLLAPYPTLEEKKVLSFETGLKMRQIDDWFINARRRSGWTKLVRDGCGLQAKGAATAKNMSKAKALGRIHISDKVRRTIAERLARKEERPHDPASRQLKKLNLLPPQVRGQVLFPESPSKMRLDFIMESKGMAYRNSSLPTTPSLLPEYCESYDYFARADGPHDAGFEVDATPAEQHLDDSKSPKVLLSPIKFRNKGGHKLRM